MKERTYRQFGLDTIGAYVFVIGLLLLIIIPIIVNGFSFGLFIVTVVGLSIMIFESRPLLFSKVVLEDKKLIIFYYETGLYFPVHHRRLFPKWYSLIRKEIQLSEIKYIHIVKGLNELKLILNHGEKFSIKGGYSPYMMRSLIATIEKKKTIRPIETELKANYHLVIDLVLLCFFTLCYLILTVGVMLLFIAQDLKGIIGLGLIILPLVSGSLLFFFLYNRFYWIKHELKDYLRDRKGKKITPKNYRKWLWMLTAFCYSLLIIVILINWVLFY